ncbi:hypothetical protein PISMIDRAFT_364741 [Pisolithus microcarpus 441]|uniref:Uncharacterized protein n=1 Tax=Pisolithus microcarpus 441 TaxID=765257 RepID=A0A0C9YV52_9AGAM|nr:hypothetical protein PISMIDRAFT_364741 [Pisolithus microcarpus 441]
MLWMDHWLGIPCLEKQLYARPKQMLMVEYRPLKVCSGNSNITLPCAMKRGEKMVYQTTRVISDFGVNALRG